MLYELVARLVESDKNSTAKLNDNEKRQFRTPIIKYRDAFS